MKANQIMHDASVKTISGEFLILQFVAKMPGIMQVALTDEGKELVESLWFGHNENITTIIQVWDYLLEDIEESYDARIVPPESIGALVGDTCPLIAFDVEYSEDCEIISTGDVYYYPDYQTSDEFAEMKNNDWIRFVKVEKKENAD